MGYCPSCGRSFAIRGSNVYENIPIPDDLIGKPVSAVIPGKNLYLDDIPVEDGLIPKGAIIRCSYSFFVPARA